MLGYFGDDLTGYLLETLFRGLVMPVSLNSAPLIIPYYSIPLVCRYFYTRFSEYVRLILKPQWPLLLSTMTPNWRNWEYLKDEPIETRDLLTKMIRTELYYNMQLSVIRTHIDRCRATHDILYRSPKSGRVYKGYVSVKRLKRIKELPKMIASHFKKLLCSHTTLHRRSSDLHKQIREQTRALNQRGILRFLLATNNGQMQVIGLG